MNTENNETSKDITQVEPVLKPAKKYVSICGYFTDEEFKQVVATAKSVTAILRHFNIPEGGGYSNAVKTHIKDLGLALPVHKNECKYMPRKKQCPICKKTFTVRGKPGLKNDTTCCSVGCSNTQFKELRYTPESNKRRVIKL
jgi:hypothetical protein